MDRQQPTPISDLARCGHFSEDDKAGWRVSALPSVLYPCGQDGCTLCNRTLFLDCANCNNSSANAPFFMFMLEWKGKGND